MEKDQLAEILAQVLTSDNKWRGEVERNMMLQKTLEELFNGKVFQQLLSRLIIPKFQDTYIPHFRAIELICALRDVVSQLYENNKLDSQNFNRELEELQFEVSDEYEISKELTLDLSLEQAIQQADEVINLYKNDSKFSTRLDKFRLLVLPLNYSSNGIEKYQVLVLKNIRPPRQRFEKK